jgi:hypothetical protein
VVTLLRAPPRPLSQQAAAEHVAIWQPGKWMIRVLHWHPDPARAPLRYRTFGPVARFDPHVRDGSQRPRDQPDGRGILYFGDTLSCGLAEAFPEQWPQVKICPNHRAIQAAPPAPVALLDLTGNGAMAIGAVGTLGSGNEKRRLTQRWGRAIYEDVPDQAGILYRAAHQGGISIAAFERAGELVIRPGTLASGTPLSGPLACRVTVALASQGRKPKLITAAECEHCRTAGLT